MAEVRTSTWFVSTSCRPGRHLPSEAGQGELAPQGLRGEADGRVDGVRCRDVGEADEADAAMPTFVVFDVGATADFPSRPPYVFASLLRDDVELMLLRIAAVPKA
jgi:hypothetical protein